MPSAAGAKPHRPGLLARLSAGELLALLGVLALGFFLALLWMAPRNMFLADLIEHQYGPVIPGSCYARNLDSSDHDLVMMSLSFLAQRKDPIAVPRAIELLHHPDDYISLNAALYLGACHRPEAVPYLIRALRHTAWRGDAERAACLRAITGMDFGTDFDRWQQWWLANHPGTQIDWEAGLGPLPRLPKKP